MFHLLKQISAALAARENLLLLAFLTLGIMGMILPVAEADLQAVSGGYGRLDGWLILSPQKASVYLGHYGNYGRSLFKFILLTAAMAGTICLFLLAWGLAWKLRKKPYLRHPSLARLLSVAFLISALGEKVLLLLLIHWHPIIPRFAGWGLVGLSYCKWGILLLIAITYALALFRYLHRGQVYFPKDRIL